jgi:phage-related protein
LQYFQTRFLEEADRFIASLDSKAVRKVLYNIDLAQQTNDPKLFKKLQKDIWEFRTRFGGHQIRLLAFWDKTAGKETLVLATHGFIKKTDKVPANEIERATRIRVKYFESKLKK